MQLLRNKLFKRPDGAKEVDPSSLGEGSEAVYYDKELGRYIIKGDREVVEKEEEERRSEAMPPPAPNQPTPPTDYDVTTSGRKIPVATGYKVKPPSSQGQTPDILVPTLNNSIGNSRFTKVPSTHPGVGGAVESARHVTESMFDGPQSSSRISDNRARNDRGVGMEGYANRELCDAYGGRQYGPNWGVNERWGNENGYHEGYKDGYGPAIDSHKGGSGKYTANPMVGTNVTTQRIASNTTDGGQPFNETYNTHHGGLAKGNYDAYNSGYGGMANPRRLDSDYTNRPAFSSRGSKDIAVESMKDNKPVAGEVGSPYELDDTAKNSTGPDLIRVQNPRNRGGGGVLGSASLSDRKSIGRDNKNNQGDILSSGIRSDIQSRDDRHNSYKDMYTPVNHGGAFPKPISHPAAPQQQQSYVAHPTYAYSNIPPQPNIAPPDIKPGYRTSNSVDRRNSLTSVDSSLHSGTFSHSGSELVDNARDDRWSGINRHVQRRSMGARNRPDSASKMLSNRAPPRYEIAADQCRDTRFSQSADRQLNSNLSRDEYGDKTVRTQNTTSSRVGATYSLPSGGHRLEKHTVPGSPHFRLENEIIQDDDDVIRKKKLIEDRVQRLTKIKSITASRPSSAVRNADGASTQGDEGSVAGIDWHYIFRGAERGSVCNTTYDASSNCDLKDEDEFRNENGELDTAALLEAYRMQKKEIMNSRYKNQQFRKLALRIRTWKKQCLDKVIQENENISVKLATTESKDDIIAAVKSSFTNLHIYMRDAWNTTVFGTKNP